MELFPVPKIGEIVAVTLRHRQLVLVAYGCPRMPDSHQERLTMAIEQEFPHPASRATMMNYLQKRIRKAERDWANFAAVYAGNAAELLVTDEITDPAKDC